MSQQKEFGGFRVCDLLKEHTPFYLYDMRLLEDTLEEINRLTADDHVTVHYALKANGNPRILSVIANHGLGADVVSGGEIKAALKAGFRAEEIAYSGVGKTDDEIRLGIESGIGCFNVESVPELEVIDHIAEEMGKTASVAIRVNPDIDAHTHKYITTGTADDKFGIGIESLGQVVDTVLNDLKHIKLQGLHFHIGSQIVQMKPYSMLCDRVNDLLDYFEQRGIGFECVNVGGGLGIDYKDPDVHAIPDFEQFFGIFKNGLRLRPGQRLHFELGRSVVGQCGTLIAKVLYVKQSRNKRFVILDAGMTDLIRPALYGAVHAIKNLSSDAGIVETYDVVGPVCESSDVFAHDCHLPETKRGDLIAICSAGAYGESMSSGYNMRSPAACIFNNGR